MWTFIRKVLGKSKTLNVVLGDVVFETPQVGGETSHSFLQWRVKTGLNGQKYWIGLKMIPDAYAGREGSPTNYMNFDIESAQLLRFQLDRCINEYYQRTGLSRQRPPLPPDGTAVS
jgi:hypothetical protein